MNTNPLPPLDGEDKTVAKLSCLTLFGFIAAIFRLEKAKSQQLSV